LAASQMRRQRVRRFGLSVEEQERVWELWCRRCGRLRGQLDVVSSNCVGVSSTGGRRPGAAATQP